MLSLRVLLFGTPGYRILRLMLMIQTLLLLLAILHITLQFVFRRRQWVKDNLLWCISFTLHYLFYTSTSTFILWNGVILRSKKCLRWYLKFKLILLPIHFTFIYFTIRYDWNDKRVTTGEIAFSIAVKLGLVVLSLYTIYGVYICYKKLESPIITHLYDHCHQLKEVQVKTAEIPPVDGSVKNLDNTEFANLDQYVPVDPYQLESFILNPLDIQINSKSILGEGQFGKVYEGTLHFQKKITKVAVKVAKDTQSLETIEMILQEIKVLIHVGDHENIIKFYGVTSDASFDNHLALIIELVGLGCLEEFLKEKRHTFKDFTRESGLGVHSDMSLVYINLEIYGTHSTIDLIRLSVDIAQGMEHLASKRVVHGDLSCRNVLLTHDLRAKLTDFGMSRRLYTYQMYSTMHQQKCLLPWRWMSVEAIEDLNLSEKSDVWSYGVTLWEIFTLGDFPFKDVQYSLEIPKQLRLGLMKLERPRYATLKLYNIMIECWSIDMYRRPTFQMVLKKFDEILEDIKHETQ